MHQKNSDVLYGRLCWQRKITFFIKLQKATESGSKCHRYVWVKPGGSDSF